MKTRNLAFTRRKMLRKHRRMHDPLLVFNMAIFNVEDGWDRIFNQLKIHENGTR